MNIYKKIDLESTFIEIINPKKSNIIVATIYKGMQHPKWHPKMNVIEFNKSLSNLLKKIDQEQKTVFFRRF